MPPVIHSEDKPSTVQAAATPPALQSPLPVHAPPAPPPAPAVPPLVAGLLADLGIDAGAVETALDPADEMLEFLRQSERGDRDRALYTYFRSGASIAAGMLQVLRWRFGDLARVARVLDFASGYGRVTRFLLRALPPERVWVSDIYAGGVQFQERRLGVHGIVSTVLPEDFHVAAAAVPGGFDAILVTSLFTHLAEERFVGWLRALCALLAPGGVLVFSVHDRSLLAPGVELPASGLHFEAVSESGSLAGEDYGSAWVSERFVRDALTRALAGTPQAGSLLRLPRGVCNFQDLYVAVPEGDADFSGLEFRGDPHFFLERCAVAVGAAGDRLELRGWTGFKERGSAVAVELVLAGQLLARFAVEQRRPEVAEMLGDPRLTHAGWGGSCALPAGAERTTSVLRLRVVDDLGGVHPMVAGALEALLHDSTRNDLAHASSELHASRHRTAQIEHEAAGLRARIAAMEASRFWKLRNQWFRIKGWFGAGGG
jgi:SAM-dependent methyltransferase